MRESPGGEDVNFRAFAELRSELLFRVGPDGHVTFLSGESERFCGLSPPEATGRPVGDLFVEAGPRAVAAVEQALEGMPVANHRLAVTDAAGAPRTARLDAEPVVEDGTVVGARCVVVDVTESVAPERWRDHDREREAVERTRELRTILDNAPVLVFRLDAAGRFTRWEGQALERLPLTAAERSSLTLAKMDDETAVANCRRALAGEAFRDTITFGGCHWETWYQPVERCGEVTGVIGFALDVSDDRRRGQVVEVLDRVLRHNLRNTMNIVVGEAARMQVESDEPDVTEAGERITKAGEDLLDLASAARDLQRVVVEDYRFDPVDPATVVRTTCEGLVREYPSADLRVEVATHPDARVPDTGFDVAVRELVENALEHAGRADPTVHVSVTAPDPETIRIRVADDGPGLPRMEREVLEAGREQPLHHGQGLGLWLVNWIIDEAGGELALDVEPAEGTTVTVDLPWAETPGSDTTGHAEADADD